MRPPARRRLTLVDAMVFVAAVGVALIPMRDIYVRVAFTLLPIDPSEWRSPWFYHSCAAGISAILRPFVIASSAALWLARIRRPRPSIRRVFRQPGVAATTAVLASFVLGVVSQLAEVLTAWLLDGDAVSRGDVWLSLLMALEHLSAGKAVLAVWMILWLGRAGRADRSWIDRAGRGLGCYCLVETAVFGTSEF